MAIHLDLPNDIIASPQFVVAGWIAGQSGSSPSRMTVNGQPVAHIRTHRPELSAALPQFAFVSGIQALVNLMAFPAAGQVDLEVEFDGEKINHIVGVADKVWQRQQEDIRLRDRHRAFCLAQWRCTACGADNAALKRGEGQISCGNCATAFVQTGRALNMLSGPLIARANLAETALVSSNPYTPEALALIERVTGRGGMVLDCGAGARPARLHNVINLEIVDYPSTDVLAVGESLPFADGTFDGILSLAVLEHVRDPFRCAQELVRVLKPGGELRAEVPFLQPEHGYPHHYYNMTAQGLRNLFPEEMDVVGAEVPLNGHPILAVQWILREYRAGLPAGAAEAFAAMRVEELANLDLASFLADPRITALAPQTQQTIACLTALHLRKP